TALQIVADDVDPAALILTVPFQIRKRGVETRLILADAPSPRDDTLLRNIAMAHHWFTQIKAGQTFAEIADREGTSKRRIQQMIDLAFLAPDIVRDVLDGRQPIGFTSDWGKQHSLPSDWTEQRALLATL
ncbi:recombinase family protein, partial [Loktanella sp. DJP18]